MNCKVTDDTVECDEMNRQAVDEEATTVQTRPPMMNENDKDILATGEIT